MVTSNCSSESRKQSLRYFKGFANLKNKARGLSTIIHAIQSPNCRNAYNKNAGVFRTEHTKEPRRLITDKNSLYSYNILLEPPHSFRGPRDTVLLMCSLSWEKTLRSSLGFCNSFFPCRFYCKYYTIFVAMVTSNCWI